MKESPFFFEIKDVMTQFVGAFNDVIIKRHNRYKQIRQRVKVRYVYAPKQRVIHDLTNKARHITLPVVAVNIAGISRDESRVFNKIYGSFAFEHERNISKRSPGSVSSAYQLPQPVPINIEVNMSILARYQTDVEQIISNFVPFSDPYIIISWKIPEGFTPNEQEIRSEVNWSGNLNVNYPEDLSSSEPYRLSCDTSFTIKTWLFKPNPGPINVVHKITTNMTPAGNDQDIQSSDFSYALPFYDDVSERSYIEGLGAPLTAAPFITHIDEIGDQRTILGYNFLNTTNVYISGTNINSLSGEHVNRYNSTLFPAFTGVPVDFDINNDNKMTFKLPESTDDTELDVIILNDGGYDTALGSTLHGKGIKIY